VNEVSGKHTKILLIEDNPGDVRLLKEILTDVNTGQYKVVHVDCLSKGLKILSENSFDLILLDLSLPDSQSLDTFVKAHTQVPKVPIVVLTGLNDEMMAVSAVRQGAQDYLVKGEVDSNLLGRAIRYAIERQQLQVELRAMSLVDELTGLYNRRGFLILAQQQLKLAQRIGKEMLLLFADLDNMKQINDTLGHQEGDKALIKIAYILRDTYRKSDIIARIGGDEFVVLAIEASEDKAEILISRLQKNLNNYNTQENLHYKLSISVGISVYDPKSSCSIDELIARADVLMYEQKRNKHKS
jgi:two-component system cell cycle response regulator